MSLNITDVRVQRLDSPSSKIVGFASITIDGVLVIEEWRIINGTNGLFVAPNSKKLQDGSYRDLVYALDKETKEQIQTAIVSAYEGGKPKTKATPNKKRSGSHIPDSYMDMVAGPEPTDDEFIPQEEEHPAWM